MKYKYIVVCIFLSLNQILVCIGLVEIGSELYFILFLLQTTAIIGGLIYEYKSLVKLLKTHYPERYSLV